MAPPPSSSAASSPPAFASARLRLSGAQVFAALRGSLAGRPAVAGVGAAGAAAAASATPALAAPSLPAVPVAFVAPTTEEEQVVRLVLDLPGRFIG